MLKLVGLGGDAGSAPAETIVAYWAALAAGADGIALQVRSSKAGELRCVPAGIGRAESEPDFEDFDAGVGTAWAGSPSRGALRYPRLRDVLRAFGRRTSIMVRVAEPSAIAPLETLLAEFGLSARVPVIAPRKVVPGGSKLRWIAELDLAAIADGKPSDAEALAWTWTSPEQFQSVAREAAKHGLPLWLLDPEGSAVMPLSAAASLARESAVAGLVSAAVLPALEQLRPGYVVFRDSLRNTRLDREQWAGGYSHPNSETSLEPRADGFSVVIGTGREYSGGGLVTRFAVCGAFDARVDFHASRVQQASTFELAAIALDPGAGELDARKLTGTNVHLSFDVHGAPPYASSECDENDGYRFGWNNASNLTRILEDWSHDSANMYNKYGRDVGPGRERTGPVSGALRLIRNGAVFASYFKDATTSGWVCSGAGLVSALPADVFIRLAAKHWRKGGEPPAAQITFSDFVLAQP